MDDNSSTDDDLMSDTEFNQIVPRRFRPFFSEDEIVGGGPALVTMPFDLDLRT